MIVCILLCAVFFLLEQQNNKSYTGQTNQLVHCVVCIISDDNKLLFYFITSGC